MRRVRAALGGDSPQPSRSTRDFASVGAAHSVKPTHFARVSRGLRANLRVRFKFLRYSWYDDARVMQKYAVWLYELIAGVFKEREHANELALSCVKATFESIRQACTDVLEGEKQRRALALVDAADAALFTCCMQADAAHTAAPFDAEVRHYLDLLFSRDILVRSIVNMAKALGMNVIAEGVETREQEQLLLSLGCRYAQGYLYAKPRSADYFLEVQPDRRARRAVLRKPCVTFGKPLLE